MSFFRSHFLTHITPAQAALLASGDLPAAEQAALRSHVLFCKSCRAELASFRQTLRRLESTRGYMELPKAFDWNELESSMAANIRLGFEVESVTPRESVPEAEPGIILSFRAVAALAALAVIFGVSWLLSSQTTYPYFGPTSASLAEVESGGLTVTGRSEGIEVSHQGRALLLRASTMDNSNIEVGLEGSVRSSSVDEESGQITVSQVSLGQSYVE